MTPDSCESLKTVIETVIVEVEKERLNGVRCKFHDLYRIILEVRGCITASTETLASNLKTDYVEVIAERNCVLFQIL